MGRRRRIRRAPDAGRDHKNMTKAPSMPASVEPPNRDPLTITGHERVLILPDVHIPYHDPEALRLAIEEGVRRKSTVVFLNGDFGDFFACSHWQTNPKQRDLKTELEAMRQGLAWLRSRFPKSRIIYKAGNHEFRWDRYLWANAPELVGLPLVDMRGILGLADIGVEWVDHLTPVHIDQLLVLHGHEYRFSISNPVNPARGLFLRTAVTSMCSHFHQRAEHSARDGNGRLITTWSTGCLCQLSPDYAPRNNWSHGFAFVDLHGKSFDVHNLRVINGKVCY